MFNPSSPVTGSAITGLTSPTFTLTSDVGPDVNSKQWAVTNLGGTQPGVLVHAPATPFTVTIRKPKQVKSLGFKNQLTGQYTKIPVNEYKLILRKGAAIQAGQYAVSVIDCSMRVPAGVDSYDAVQLSAAFSLLGGLMTAQLQGLKDTAVTGII